MKVGEALRRVFVGMTVTSRSTTWPVQYGYGDQAELIKWINLKDKANKPKYPLIWYVITPYSEFNGELELTTARLIVLQDTKPKWFNDQRAEKSYDDFIYPTVTEVKKRLKLNQYITVFGANFDQYREKDEPNYGVDLDNPRTGQNDFTSKRRFGEQSIVQDIVDARILQFHMRIKPDCII